MGRLGKGLTNSLTLSTKSPNNKQKAGTSIIDISNQYLRKLLKEFKNLSNFNYNKKQVHNEPTES